MSVLCWKPSNGFQLYLKYKSKHCKALHEVVLVYLSELIAYSCHSAQDIPATVAFPFLKYAKLIFTSVPLYWQVPLPGMVCP